MNALKSLILAFVIGSSFAVTAVAMEEAPSAADIAAERMAGHKAGDSFDMGESSVVVRAWGRGGVRYVVDGDIMAKAAVEAKLIAAIEQELATNVAKEAGDASAGEATIGFLANVKSWYGAGTAALGGHIAKFRELKMTDVRAAIAYLTDTVRPYLGYAAVAAVVMHALIGEYSAVLSGAIEFLGTAFFVVAAKDFVTARFS